MTADQRLREMIGLLGELSPSEQVNLLCSLLLSLYVLVGVPRRDIDRICALWDEIEPHLMENADGR
jgi:hypothetical protein